MKNHKRAFTVIFYGTMGAAIGWIFYRHVVPVVAFIGVGIFIGYKVEKHDNKYLLLEFKTFMNGVYSEIMVGQSLRTAVATMHDLYTFQDEALKNALNVLVKSIKLGKGEIEAWRQFEQTLNEPFITTFVDTLEATYYYSGQVTAVIRHTIYSISDAIDLTLEMEVIIAGKKMEFYTMMILPIALLGLLSHTQYDYLTILYETLLGRCLMSGILLWMLTAYMIGKKLIDIEGAYDTT